MDEGQIIREQFLLLKELQSLSPKRPILVQHSLNEKWHSCNHDRRILTRSILPNEVIFDFDFKEWSHVKAEGDKLITWLKERGAPFILAHTGGKGVHVHLLLDSEKWEIAKDIGKAAKEFNIDLPRMARETVFDLVIRGAGLNAEGLDRGKVAWSEVSKGSMIREFGCLRDDGGVKTVITEIPASRPEPGSLPLAFPEAVERWDITKQAPLINIALEDRIKALRDYIPPVSEYKGSADTIPCFPVMMNGGNEGQRNAIAYSLSLLMKKCGTPEEEAKTALSLFVSRCDNADSDLEKQLLKTLEGAYRKDYRLSCWKIRKDVGEEACQRQKCPLWTCAAEEKPVSGSAEPSKSEYVTEKPFKLLEPFRDEDGALGFAVLFADGGLLIKSLGEWREWSNDASEGGIEKRIMAIIEAYAKEIYWECKDVPLPRRPVISGYSMPKVYTSLLAELKLIADMVDEAHYHTQVSWSICTWLKDLLDYAPRNQIIGPTRSGKGRVLAYHLGACHRGHDYSNPTPAVLFRDIENHSPTIFIDSWQKINDERRHELESLWEKGFQRGGTVGRVEGDYKVHRYKVFSWMAIASIKSPKAEDLVNRSIATPMFEKSKDKKVKRHLDMDLFSEMQGHLLSMRLEAFQGGLDVEKLKTKAFAIAEKTGDMDPRSLDMAESMIVPCLMANDESVSEMIIKQIMESQGRATNALSDTLPANIFYALQEIVQGCDKVKSTLDGRIDYRIATRDVADKVNAARRTDGEAELHPRTITGILGDLNFKMERGSGNKTFLVHYEKEKGEQIDCFTPVYQRHLQKFGLRDGGKPKG